MLCLAAAPPEETRGKSEYDKALKYYGAEELEAALPLFEKAYQLSNHRPSTILGLAQCERALKMYDRALLHYREFLATNPKPSDAASVKETIAMIEDVRDRNQELSASEETGPHEEKMRVQPASPTPVRTATQTALVAPPPAPKEDSASVLASPYFWIAAAGIAVLGGGAVFFATRSSRADSYGGTTGLFFRP